MTTLIQQRLKSDCAICTIAMATGRTYEEVIAVSEGHFDPEKGTRGEEEILKNLGLSYEFDKNHQPIGDFVNRHKDWAIDAAYFRMTAWGRRAILAVPSLNIPGGFHSVYYDGKELFDPCLLKTYTGFEQLMPIEMILFRER